MTQRELIGPGTIGSAGQVLDELSARRVFLVTGRASFAASGAEEKLSAALAGREVARFRDFAPNPQFGDACAGAERFAEFAPDAVVAVGGGSVLDTAKLVNYFGATGLEPVKVIQGAAEAVEGGRPMVAIPTTAGSGSEATRFAVFYLGRAKHTLALDCLLPSAAIVDPDLTASQPPALTATAGMDALAQAVESYWSVHSTDASKAFARPAIQRVLANLSKAVHQPAPACRGALAEAANLAGKAINLTRTTAPHAASYPLTALYGVPHGHAVALTLGAFLRYNAQVGADDVQDARGLEYVRTTLGELVEMLGAATAPEAAERLEELMRDIGLAVRLCRVGVRTRQELAAVLDNVKVPAKMNNNPRRVTGEALREILQSVW